MEVCPCVRQVLLLLPLTSLCLERRCSHQGESEFQTQYLMSETVQSVIRIRHVDFWSSFLTVFHFLPQVLYKHIAKWNDIKKTLRKSQSFFRTICQVLCWNNFHSLFHLTLKMTFRGKNFVTVPTGRDKLHEFLISKIRWVAFFWEGRGTVVRLGIHSGIWIFMSK